jgi:transcriptional regulator with XRE-family HTH domain
MSKLRFADWLLYTRQKNKLTQEELAKKVGVSRVQISRYENYFQYPRISVVEKMVEVMDCDTLPVLAPVVAHAKWVETPAGEVICSKCRTDFGSLIKALDGCNYCPNCGAQMDMEDAKE